MLAHPVSDRPVDYDSGPVFIQPKLDGVRCLIQYDNSTVTAYSRTGKEWKNIDHILFNLKPFFQLNPDVVLDGELYNHELKDDFEKIISCVRKTKPTDEHRAESEKLVQFHCYDVIKPSPRGLSFSVRDEWIQLNVPLNFCIKHVDSIPVRSDDDALWQNSISLKAGYEGSILRTNDIYQHKRSHNLRKFKQFHDAEARIIGWVAGKGKRTGTIGKFLAMDKDGNTFGMPVMDKQKYLEENFEKMQGWVGKIATFKYFERTKANSYRHPLFKCIRDYE
ncbi:putative ATP DNA ligase [uncultured virus]|uniref:DNA ligase n=1 Tax=uncultured virus TaxID=340016 RepID=A0A218ML87_9VIRU|nr:putative ATP DNA ligase [uncultured virus]